MSVQDPIIKRIRGRVASAVSAHRVVVEAVVDFFERGDLLNMAAIYPGHDAVYRVGAVVVEDWNEADKVLTLRRPLNQTVPAAAQGDYLLTGIIDCTRCCCERCGEDRAKIEAMLSRGTE